MKNRVTSRANWRTHVTHNPSLWLLTGALLCTLLAMLWLGWSRAGAQSAPHAPREATAQAAFAAALTPGTVATMDSPVFTYTDSWTVDSAGADPHEPRNPAAQPAGVVMFEYTGAALALDLAVGDYWGYLFVTVDGQPANLLPSMAGNVDSLGNSAGYKPLYAPDVAPDVEAGPQSETNTLSPTAPRWIEVDRRAAGRHSARVEVWRSWGQTPIRAVGIDALPPAARPVWPAGLLSIAAFWLALAGLGRRVNLRQLVRFRPAALGRLSTDPRVVGAARPLAIVGAAAVATGAAFNVWWLTLAGLAMLSLAALVEPVLWLAALLAGLPFYYAFTLPVLPSRQVSLIDVGVFGGALLFGLHWLMTLAPPDDGRAGGQKRPDWTRAVILWLPMALASWAWVSTLAADRLDVAHDEWRTVFLAGAIFALLLTTQLRAPAQRQARVMLLVGAWLLGATVVAAAGLWQFATGNMTIAAEGVQRIRGFYDSPNNLALYLDRTLPVALALALFGTNRSWRIIAFGAAAIMGAALLLTFSKGALFLAAPTMLVILWWGGRRLLRAQGRPATVLWVMAGLAGVALLALLPFLGTDRFQRLLDLRQGTGFLRLQLWRSAWQMALDHPVLGVGPDNFLYAYRSGYLLPTAWQEPNLNHPHNWLLDWWTRLGLPGLVLGVSFWSGGVALIRRRLAVVTHTADAQEAALLLGLLAASAAALVHGLIDVSYALPDLMLVWMLLFGLAAGRGSRASDSLAP